MHQHHAIGVVLGGGRASLDHMYRVLLLCRSFEADRDKGVFSDLPELHALSSGLKATCTGTTADGIEAARRCCGGHGYSALSGLPRLFASYVQNVTWEGDNNVLYLQVRGVLCTLCGVRAVCLQCMYGF